MRPRVPRGRRALRRRAVCPGPVPGPEHEPAPGRAPERRARRDAPRRKHHLLPTRRYARPRGVSTHSDDRPLTGHAEAARLRGRKDSSLMTDIRAATDATFESMVIKNDKPVLVDFWAAWCGPCKMVAPEMEKLARKYDGAVEVVKVDVDAKPGLSRAFNILSIPTIAFFQPGKQPMGVVGFRPMEQLETQFNLSSFPKIAEAAAAESAEAEAGTAAASDAA